jgi:4'-phosphopantetheinyl transferase
VTDEGGSATPVFGRRTVAEQVAVGWAAPSQEWVRAPLRGAADARRVESFAPSRRQAFLTGRALLGLLGRELFPGVNDWTPDTGPCPRCGAEHGPVEVHGVPAVASVAYTDGLVVAALASTGSAIRLGVDVEVERPDPVRAADLGALLGVPPAAALRRWTQVEAVLKATGHGLRVDPGLVRFHRDAARVDGDAATYRVLDVDGPPGFAISLAWRPRLSGQ